MAGLIKFLGEKLKKKDATTGTEDTSTSSAQTSPDASKSTETSSESQGNELLASKTPRKSVAVFGNNPVAQGDSSGNPTCPPQPTRRITCIRFVSFS